MPGVGRQEDVERSGVFDLAGQLRGGRKAENGMDLGLRLESRADRLADAHQVGGRRDDDFPLRRIRGVAALARDGAKGYDDQRS